jgi:hypothetical protein
MSDKHSIGKTIAEIIPGFDQYKKIVEVIFVPGRPGEEYFVVVDSAGKKFELSGDQFQRLDRVMKGPNSETAREWQRLIRN